MAEKAESPIEQKSEKPEKSPEERLLEERAPKIEKGDFTKGTIEPNLKK